MSRLFRLLILVPFVANAFADTATDSAFQNLTDEYIADLGNLSPVNATLIGAHETDDKLDHVDSDARKETISLFRSFYDLGMDSGRAIARVSGEQVKNTSRKNRSWLTRYPPVDKRR